MKKSKVFLALAAVLLVVLCCSAAGCFDSASTEKKNADAITSAQSELSETNSKAIYSGCRTDRIKVIYNTSETERLPWNVIYVFDESPRETKMLLEIPEGMTLKEAIEYCNNCSFIDTTIPGNEYIQSVLLGQGSDLDIETDRIWVICDRNSSYRLPWELKCQVGEIYEYKVPNNMTFPEAFAYCNTINDIMYVGCMHKYYAASGSSGYSGESPVPLAGVLIGLLCAGVILLRRRN